MKQIIEKILLECDADIRDVMLERSEQKKNLMDAEFYQNYELLNDPVKTLIEWQQLRYVRRQIEMFEQS